MSSYFKVFFLCFAIGSCSFINFDAPRNMDNACSILQQRPSFDRAFQKTKRRWGAPVHVQMAILYQESKFIPNAKTPRKYFLGVVPWGRQSSAYGYAQALDGTWADYKKSSGRRFASRSNMAYRGLCDSRKHFEKCTLTRTIATDQTNNLPFCN